MQVMMQINFAITCGPSINYGGFANERFGRRFERSKGHYTRPGALDIGHRNSLVTDSNKAALAALFF